MENSEHEQCGHGIVQDFSIRAIQFGNSNQGEAKRHVLDEIVVSTAVEEKGIGLVIRGGFGCVDITVAHVLFGLDSTIDDAVGQVDAVRGKWQRP